jgi:hypothetical protein
MTESTPPKPTSSSPDSAPKKEKKARPKGFASIIYGQLKLLQGSEYFKTNFSEDKFTILIEATDDNDAAFVKSDHGTVDMDDINKKKEDIKKYMKLADAKIITTYDHFMKLAFSHGYKEPLLMVLKGQVKVRGLKVILKFLKYMSVAGHIQKDQIKAMKAQAEKDAILNQPPADQSSSAKPNDESKEESKSQN